MLGAVSRRRLFLQSGLFWERGDSGGDPLEAMLAQRSDPAKAALLMHHAPAELALLDLKENNPDR